jgi:hypothetical protein
VSFPAGEVFFDMRVQIRMGLNEIVLQKLFVDVKNLILIDALGV